MASTSSRLSSPCMDAARADRVLPKAFRGARRFRLTEPAAAWDMASSISGEELMLAEEFPSTACMLRKARRAHAR